MEGAPPAPQPLTPWELVFPVGSSTRLSHSSDLALNWWHSSASAMRHFSQLWSFVLAFYTTPNEFQGLPLAEPGLNRILMSIKSNTFN